MSNVNTKDTKDTNPKDLLGAKKPDLSLIPPVASIHLALALMNGEKKYGAYNWRTKGVRLRVYIAAAMRHLKCFLDGEDYALDSNVHHLGHAMACEAIALDSIALGNAVDDRPLPGKASALIEECYQKILALEEGEEVAPYEKKASTILQKAVEAAWAREEAMNELERHEWEEARKNIVMEVPSQAGRTEVFEQKVGEALQGAGLEIKHEYKVADWVRIGHLIGQIVERAGDVVTIKWQDTPSTSPVRIDHPTLEPYLPKFKVGDLVTFDNYKDVFTIWDILLPRGNTPYTYGITKNSGVEYWALETVLMLHEEK
jgi:hypothetical protein